MLVSELNGGEKEEKVLESSIVELKLKACEKNSDLEKNSEEINKIRERRINI